MAFDSPLSLGNASSEGRTPDSQVVQLTEEHMRHYSNLSFHLKAHPRQLAALVQVADLSEIDRLLQTIMFSFYKDQNQLDGTQTADDRHLLSMIRSITTAQWNSDSEARVEVKKLLRKHTPVSRALLTYVRRPSSQTYLQGVLREEIQRLVEHKDLNLEIEPTRVYAQVTEQIEKDHGSIPDDLPREVTAETAAANLDVLAIISNRLPMLTAIGNGMLRTMVESLDSVPYGIRWICKQIRDLTKRNYPRADKDVLGRCVGEFFLLRYICPLLVTPHAYRMIEGVPAKNPRRSLTILSKMFSRTLTDDNDVFEAKEEYLGRLQSFFDENRPYVTEFLNRICDVEDFDDSINEHAVDVNDSVLVLELHEVISIHHLLSQHIDAIQVPTVDGSVELRELLDKCGPPPPQVSFRSGRRVIEFRRSESTSDSHFTEIDLSAPDVNKVVAVQ